MSEECRPDDFEQLSSVKRDSASDLLCVGDISENIDTFLLDQIYNSTFKGTQSDCEWTISNAIGSGVSAEKLADVYIPLVARMLGDAWCRDTKSFAQVTIGVARLRGALKLLGPAWSSDSHAGPDASTVLLVVSKGAQHTLGATILTGQLRRLGVSVRLCIDATAKDVGELVDSVKFDSVWISASIGESLESLRLIVDAAKSRMSAKVPVVLGGTIIADERSVQALTGADLLTVSISEAINFCGLKTKLCEVQTTQELTPSTPRILGTRE